MNTTQETANHIIGTERAAGAGRSISVRSGARLAIGLGLAAALGFGGAQTFADDSSEAPDTNPPPGEPVVVDPGDAPVDVVGDSDSLVLTLGDTFDPTILTKFIPASAFIATQGDPASGRDDRVLGVTHGCLSPASVSTGSMTRMYAPVELPDGSRIKRVEFYGDDNGADDITISLRRTEATLGAFAAPQAALDSTLVTSFSTSGVSAGDAVAFMSDDNLAEVTGSIVNSDPIFSESHRFHTVQVAMDNAALNDQQLCGVEIEYQVPLVKSGEAFFPVQPMRVFDSRINTYANSGPLAPNDSKVVDVSDGYDLAGVAIPGLVDAVPAGATAITYNIAVTGTTGPNFVSATAGNATEFSAAVLNFAGGQSLSNSATVPVDGSQQIKVWGGDQAGSAHVIIDITGYYAPGAHPNMGN